ncbi:transporter [Tenacibaculum sp. ZS6-P6]|uniref:transporter n=1 Tax=Tenacibaculum sp. ZS6-P6 TaxID=3447503 RepID=UPI003F994926
MKNVVFTIVMIFTLSISYAQFQENIDSGRPGNAISVFTVGKNVGQVELGLDYSDNLEVFSSNPFLRYGITEKIEINGGVSYDFSNSDLVSYNLGAKFNIFEGDTMMPSSAFFVNFNFSNNSLIKPSSTALFIFNHQFYGGLNITANLGVNVDLEPSTRIGVDGEGNPKTSEVVQFQGVYTLNFSYGLDDQWTIFVEPFGGYDKFSDTNFNLSVNGGTSYLLNKNLLIDFLVGHGISANKFLTVSTGVSWRIPMK